MSYKWHQSHLILSSGIFFSLCSNATLIVILIRIQTYCIKVSSLVSENPFLSELVGPLSCDNIVAFLTKASTVQYFKIKHNNYGIN